MYSIISDDVKLGKDVKIYSFVNLYGCEIGDQTKIGTFVEIQKECFHKLLKLGLKPVTGTGNRS